MSKTKKRTDFGFNFVQPNEKTNLVREVFDNVSSKYDLMNDLLSFGLHRFWKQELINLLSPQSHQNLADIAGGTGDIAKKFIENGGGKADIIDININMIKHGIKKDYNSKIRYIVGNCERLPIASNTYDRVSIGFGLRNITYRQEALKEIFRILKPGGRFICLEFSQVQDKHFKKLYDFWSFYFLPKIGSLIAQNESAYKYLAESIRMFPNQEKLSFLLSKANFSRVKCKNLAEGIVALHSGWKI